MTLSRDSRVATGRWRPMAFGAEEPKRIRNPLGEPLWAGRRVLVDVNAVEVGIRDENGEQLPGYDALRAALTDASRAIELVLDGYLLPAPLRRTVGAESAPGSDAMMSPGDVTRQMFLGGAGRRRARELELAEARRVYLPPDGPTAFVAVDLLWLDGDSLLDIPLLERKRLLDSAIEDHELVRRGVLVRPPFEAWYAQWKALGFQEIAIKDANSRYEPGGVSRAWTTAVIPRR